MSVRRRSSSAIVGNINPPPPIDQPAEPKIKRQRTRPSPVTIFERKIRDIHNACMFESEAAQKVFVHRHQMLQLDALRGPSNYRIMKELHLKFKDAELKLSGKEVSTVVKAMGAVQIKDLVGDHLEFAGKKDVFRFIEACAEYINIKRCVDEENRYRNRLPGEELIVFMAEIYDYCARTADDDPTAKMLTVRQLVDRVYYPSQYHHAVSAFRRVFTDTWISTLSGWVVIFANNLFRRFFALITTMMVLS